MSSSASIPFPKKIGVLFGSETGTAEEVAHRVASELLLLCTSSSSPPVSSNQQKQKTEIVLLPIDDSHSQHYTEWKTTHHFDLIIFIIATAGNGDPPRTMRKTWKQLLIRNQSKSTLEGLNFCVFGLGDSTYPRFNYMAKMMHNRLSSGLGANPVVHRQLGDDEDPQGYESELRPFLGILYSQVLNLIKEVPAELDELKDEEERLLDQLEEAQEQEDENEEIEAEIEKKMEEIEEKMQEVYRTKIDVDKNELFDIKQPPKKKTHDGTAAGDDHHRDDEREANSNSDDIIIQQQHQSFLLSDVQISSKSSLLLHHQKQRRERQNINNISNEDAEQEQEQEHNQQLASNALQQQQIVSSVDDYLENNLHLDKFQVTKNEKITSAEHFQDVRSLKFSRVATAAKKNVVAIATEEEKTTTTTSSSSSKYLPGDTFALYPRNPESAVQTMLEVLNLSPDEDIITINRRTATQKNNNNINISFSSTPTQPFFGLSFTARDFFTWVVDLQAATPRQLLWQFSFWVDRSLNDESINFDGEEIYDRLMQLSRYSMDDFMEYSTRERRPIYETLQDFLPILNTKPESTWRNVVISYLKPIAVRHFSICRFDEPSLSPSPLLVELLVAIHKVTTPMKRQRVGLCSEYIQDFLTVVKNDDNDDEQQQQLHEDCDRRSSTANSVFCHGYVERNVHTLPFDEYEDKQEANRKMILVGPGTGIAPIRAVIQRLVYTSSKTSSSSNNNSKNILVFTGHRHPQKDYPFGKEWDSISSSSSDIKFYHAFSRFKEQVPSKVKYVQQAMTQDAETKKAVAKIIEQNPIIIISGNAKQMPKDVNEAMVQCLVDAGVDKDKESATKRLETLRQKGRYVVDAWA